MTHPRRSEPPTAGPTAGGATSLRALARSRHTRLLGWVLALNAGLMAAEIIGGLAFGSLALLADGAHMVSDVTGLAIALIAQKLMARRVSARHSYGLQRADVLAAQANATVLLGTAVWVIVEAIRRIGAPPTIEAGGTLVIATLGLVANAVSVVVLVRSRDESLNMRAAFVHMSADAAGSVGVIAAGVAAIGSVYWVDPAVSLLLGVGILCTGGRLLADSTHILMEGTPRSVDLEEVASAIKALDGVETVHHLHAWHLASDTIALSAHIVAYGHLSLDGAQAIADRTRTMLEDRFGITHATLELENRPCG